MVSIQFLEGTVALVKWHDKDIGNKFKLNFNLNGLSQVSWGFLFCFVLFESLHKGFPGSSDGKKVCLQPSRHRFNPWVCKIPWKRIWQPTPVFLPGKIPEERGGLQSMGSQESGI